MSDSLKFVTYAILTGLRILAVLALAVGPLFGGAIALTHGYTVIGGVLIALWLTFMIGVGADDRSPR